MSHMIWGSKFAAVRVPCWHGIGKVYEDDVLPSVAATDIGLLYEVDKYPLVIKTPDGRDLNTGLAMVGRVMNDELINYGVASKFDLVMLEDVLPNLDELASRYPLSATGALRKGAEAFFTFEVSNSTEIVGEEYREYLTVVHSYSPGVAHRFIYSPVRVVCQNTLVASVDRATSKFAVSHAANSKDRLDAGYIIGDAIARASAVKRNLEKLAQTGLNDEYAKGVVEKVYSRYQPSRKVDSMVADLVDDQTMSTLFNKKDSQERYFKNLCGMAMSAYDVLNQEHPKTAGTAYNLYQAVVEVADYRKGKSTVGNMESAVVGVRATEKRVAWDLLTSMVD